MNDPHRPLYHFSPDHWMNDPIPFFWDGTYHVFFQHNPNGAFWGTMHWAHAVSRDLVHWEQLPIALAPTPSGPDAEGCWTGCVTRSAGRFRILYTGISKLKPLRQTQCMAESDDLVTWRKYPGNPVIDAPPAGFGECFRDPQVWREGDAWYMVVGSEQKDGKGGAALLYRAGSDDLTRWEYLHPLCLGDAAKTGHDLECPDFFPLGGGHVLLSSRKKTWWQGGRYADHRFTADKWGAVDGGQFYAGKTFVDGKGRRVLLGWVREGRAGEEQKKAGWSGVLSLPRVLSLGDDGVLRMEPAEEIEALRKDYQWFGDLPLGDGQGATLDVRGDALEIIARFEGSAAKAFGVVVRATAGGREGVEVAYDGEKVAGAPFKLAENEGLDLRVFVDRSVVEVFANNRACATLRTYPERADALGVRLFARGGAVEAHSVDVWTLG